MSPRCVRLAATVPLLASMFAPDEIAIPIWLVGIAILGLGFGLEVGK